MLQSPNLHRVRLSIGADALGLPLAWSKLTELLLSCHPDWDTNGSHSGGLDQHGTLELLRRCPNLVWCQFQLTTETQFNSVFTVTLSYLQSLFLATDTGAKIELVKFMECLILPQLYHLCVVEPTFALLRSPPAHSVEVLTIHISPVIFTQACILQVLEMFPGVSRLILTALSSIFGGTDDLDDHFLAALTPTSEHSPICPTLTHIAITSNAPTFSQASVAPFIRGRMDASLPLQALSIEFTNHDMEVDVIPELEEFIKEGRVEIKYPSPPSPCKYNAATGLLVLPEDAIGV
ncbi:hypothetical protein B0H19DRAFT_420825 [Mycena capillaripes]|nr:hypothetical protein B0H19DRAFT_420825 [Mycena capillaripes]